MNPETLDLHRQNHRNSAAGVVQHLTTQPAVSNNRSPSRTVFWLTFNFAASVSSTNR